MFVPIFTSDRSVLSLSRRFTFRTGTIERVSFTKVTISGIRTILPLLIGLADLVLRSYYSIVLGEVVVPKIYKDVLDSCPEMTFFSLIILINIIIFLFYYLFPLFSLAKHLFFILSLA